MLKEIITSPDAPNPIGPYSHAVRAGDFLYVSGQVALDAVTGQMLNTGDVASETEQVMRNLHAILTEAGMTFANVVKTTIFLTDFNDFKTVNEVYGARFESNFPSRETVEVSRLPRDARVEISMIAFNF